MVVHKAHNIQEHNTFKSKFFWVLYLNGNSVIDFKEDSKKESVCELLDEIRSKNPEKSIVIILDNFRSHRANITIEFAKNNGIELVYLPPYSPELNPIEFIWKSIKKVVSREFIVDLDHIRGIIRDKFQECASHLSFAKRWIEKFLMDEYKLEMFGF